MTHLDVPGERGLDAEGARGLGACPLLLGWFQ